MRKRWHQMTLAEKHRALKWLRKRDKERMAERRPGGWLGG